MVTFPVSYYFVNISFRKTTPVNLCHFPIWTVIQILFKGTIFHRFNIFTAFTENMQYYLSVIHLIFSYPHQSGTSAVDGSVAAVCLWLFSLMCMKQHILPQSHEHPYMFFVSFFLWWYLFSGILLIFLYVCCFKCCIWYLKW